MCLRLLTISPHVSFIQLISDSNLLLIKNTELEELIVPNGDVTNSSLDYLPSNLKVLQLFDYYSPPSQKYRYEYIFDNLPDSLQELILPPNYARPLDHLPSGLKYLKLNRY